MKNFLEMVSFIILIGVTLVLIMSVIVPRFLPREKQGITGDPFPAKVKDIAGNKELYIVYTGIGDNPQELDASKLTVVTTNPKNETREFTPGGKIKPFERIIVDIPDDTSSIFIYYEGKLVSGPIVTE